MRISDWSSDVCSSDLYAGGIMPRSAIGEVIAVDRRKYDVLEPHQLDGLGDIFGFERIEPAMRVARADRAELAGARTHRAHQHERRRAPPPAFGDVRTLGFGTHRKIGRAHV